MISQIDLDLPKCFFYFTANLNDDYVMTNIDTENVCPGLRITWICRLVGNSGLVSSINEMGTRVHIVHV